MPYFCEKYFYCGLSLIIPTRQRLKVCKDLQILDGGELLIKGAADDADSVDFTGAELVKEVELVFGTVTGSGTLADPFVFTAANPGFASVFEPLSARRKIVPISGVSASV